MAVTINADTTNGLVITPDTSGEINFQTNGTTVAGMNSTGWTGDGSQLTGITTGKILQVVSTTLTTPVSSSTAQAWFDISGFSATITPSSTSSKILVFLEATGTLFKPAVSSVYLRLNRSGTVIGVGTSVGSRLAITTTDGNSSADCGASASMVYLDSPATTSSRTYTVQGWQYYGNSLQLNRTVNDTDNFNYNRSISTITLMEVGA